MLCSLVSLLLNCLVVVTADEKFVLQEEADGSL